MVVGPLYLLLYALCGLLMAGILLVAYIVVKRAPKQAHRVVSLSVHPTLDESAAEPTTRGMDSTATESDDRGPMLDAEHGPR